MTIVANALAVVEGMLTVPVVLVLALVTVLPAPSTLARLKDALKQMRSLQP